MSPNPASPSRPLLRSRRRLLATAGAVSLVATAGCNALASSGGPDGEGDTVEVVVVNDTDDPVSVAVRITDRDGDPLFSRVYELDPRHTDESAGVDTRPARVAVFTPDGTSASWAYAPSDHPRCEGKDVGITVTDEGFESWYGC